VEALRETMAKLAAQRPPPDIGEKNMKLKVVINPLS
jgi:hypothetical protein